MKMLAIDTATEACSVALAIDDEVTERYTLQDRSHADLTLAMVDELLAEAGISLNALDAIAFDRGPGSFTGIRIGTSIVQGLAFGADLPVVPVSSLATLATGVWRRHQAERVVAMLDARMNEIYWACFEQQGDALELVGEEKLSPPEEVQPPHGEWLVAGTGWRTYHDVLSHLHGIAWHVARDELLPHAADLLWLALRQWQSEGGVEPSQALPVYLRQQVAHKKA